MNTKTFQTEHNNHGSHLYKSGSKWREATPCESDDASPCSEPNPCKKPNPRPDPNPCLETNPCTTIREKDSKETYFLLNTAHSEHKNSESISKLAWILFGLATLLFLGSLFSNLLMVWTFARTTNNVNNSREVITTTSTKEVIRVVDNGHGGDEYYYYAPAARW